ncbi:helix-turn-helix domain-containing protein [Mesorhizobium loti]|uniref:Transcriptional regulator n=1 Tax=Mesorhizobium loti R88b TaxID=935548 RepID=A0A6M7WX44_RHILI|nr:helix-turn-helix domain-containing protein [Mesorhizobium loti]QKD05199.1 transcriptional regulator [Mesorhizobium loti R88b]
MLAYTTSRTAVPLQPSDPLHPALSLSFAPTQPQPCSFFPAGAEIYAQGENAGSLYQVEFGAVRVYRLLADGRRQISAFHLSGEIFGFEADATHHFFAEAICGTGIRSFRLATGVDMSRELLPLALRGLIRAQEHLLVLGRQNAIERVAAFLVDMAERQGGLSHVELPMSRTDIGDYLGLTIETVSRIFSKLKERGIIRLPSLRTVEIAKWDALHGMGE